MTTRQIRFREIMFRCYEYTSQLKLLEAIRESLLRIVPVILIGAMALVLSSFPVQAYQDFIQSFSGGILVQFLNFLYQATFGVLSIYMVVSLTISYLDKVKRQSGSFIGPVFASLLAFVISSGAFEPGAELSSTFGTRGLFTAILCSIIGVSLYCYVQRKLRIDLHFYTSGADDVYNSMFRNLVPFLAVGIAAALFNLLLHVLFGVNSLQEAYASGIETVFMRLHRNFGSALLYVFMVHFLWFFGIHGGNVFDVVGRNVFEPSLMENQRAIAGGAVPTEIFSKSFFDVFILMGGCGSTLCLLAAILLFERRRSLRRLAKAAVIPGIFNINELMVFGVPIIYNPIMLIPFFVTPILCLITSTAAMRLGLVPVVSQQVEWTTPIFLGGYYATGSVRGAFLQLVNLCLGVAVYYPFVRILEKQSVWSGREKLHSVIRILQDSERTRIPVRLLDLRGDAGTVVRTLADELEMNIGRKTPTMYYQPQYYKNVRCIGAEALLRWNHPTYGMIYPPLVIQLMEEIGILTQAEEEILETVLQSMDRIKAHYGDKVKVSVNVTGTTIQLDEYEAFLEEMTRAYPQHIPNLVMEITEQAYIAIDSEFFDRLTRIRKMGYRLAIDDFSMGNTSIKYLQSNVFELIKLDGALTRDIEENARSRGIVQTMTQLAEKFDLDILAEYVETDAQRLLLEELGCYYYQGYLFSKALPLEEFLELEPQRSGAK